MQHHQDRRLYLAHRDANLAWKLVLGSIGSVVACAHAAHRYPWGAGVFSVSLGPRDEPPEVPEAACR